MGKSDSFSENFTKKFSVSRRTFVKSAAVGSVALMYGCSKDSNDIIVTGGGNGDTSEAPITPLEESFVGTAPHNCGGGACVLTAHVAGGRIVRLATDERTPYDMVTGSVVYDSQRRGCVRCRSKKEWFYRTDRLLYPLKQTGKRGDLKTFKRISWAQAYKEIAQETERIAKTYGAESLLKFYATGDGAAYPRSREITANILRGLGGNYPYNDDYSYPSWYNTVYYTWGVYGTAAGNSAPDMKNSKLIVLWSCNVSEMIGSCNVSWYLTQARDLGVPIISVDQRLSKTATTLSTGVAGAPDVPAVITPVSGTDSALIAAMLYHLVSKHIETIGNGDIWTDSIYLKPRHITKYIHGFFDKLPASGEGSTYSYRAEQTDTNYPVASGGSYSAYIFGNDTSLVGKFNDKASTYPDQIGYHTNGDAFKQPDGTTAVDPLHGKYAPCYGQVPKTPEWAEKITGIPAAAIKAFAELLASNFGQLSLMHNGGFQRNTEGEQNPRAFFILAAVLGAFGKSGAMFGDVSSSAATNSSCLPSFTAKNVDPGQENEMFAASGLLKDTDTNLKTKIATGIGGLSANYLDVASRYDKMRLTSPISERQWPFTDDWGFPVFLWQDAVERGQNRAQKSRWGVPAIEKGPAVKLIYNFGGNCVVNQCGNLHLTTKILSLGNAQSAMAGQDQNFPNRQYQLELLITSDHFMTTSCQWSDYVLPASMAFERNFYKGAADAVHFSPKIINAPGEVRSDFEMTIGIADAMSTPLKVVPSNLKTDDQILKSMYNAPTQGEYAGISYEEFKKLGVITSGKNGSITISHKAFYTDPSVAPLTTPTGKVEAYSQGMVEQYEARLFNNSDANITLPDSGVIYTKALGNATAGRYFYPVPMYIPLVEGRHACDGDSGVPEFGGTAASTIDISKASGATQHPDLTGSNAKQYKFRLHNWHMQYRSHSTLNSNAYLNEQYKKTVDGKSAFYALNRGEEKVYGDKAAICDTNVYEPVFVNPKLASEIGLPATGARVVIFNDRGAIYAYATPSNLVQYGEIMIGQGSWASFIDEEFTTPVSNKKHKIDTGGCSNTLTDIRPSRFCQGMTLANDCKVGIKVQ